MTTFFDWLMYTIFRNRWVLHKMRNDYKIAIFMKELDLEHQLSKHKSASERAESIRKELEEAENAPTPALTESQMADKQTKYEVEKKYKANKKRKIETLKNRLKSAETEVAMADGEVNRLNAENYKIRLKFDYVMGAKVSQTYVDYRNK
tara:strand:- start:1569 stop:2015 length:447 start_codon:yes stop_codon:yes gene_type:complete